MNRNEYIDRSLIVAAANNLVGICERNGYVLTIETQPVGTPAMGSYKMVVDVRTARHLPKPSALNLDAMCEDAMKRIKADILMNATVVRLEVAAEFAKTRKQMVERHRKAELERKYQAIRSPSMTFEWVSEGFKKLVEALNCQPGQIITLPSLDRYLRKGDSDSAS